MTQVFNPIAFYKQAMLELNARYRFDDIDTLITNPTDLEKKAAIVDALADLNSVPPVSTYTLDQITDPSTGDPRLLRFLYLLTGRNILRMLVIDWTSNGFTAQMDEFNVEDRLDRYKMLLDMLDNAINDQTGGLAAFKVANSKFTHVAYAGLHNPILKYRYRPFSVGGALRW